MPTRVNTTTVFLEDVERLWRKYHRVEEAVATLIIQLEQDERPGDKVPGVGYDVYKVRLPNRSAKRGKSGGFRVVYYIRRAENVLLLTIYSKSEQENISTEAIRRIIEEHGEADESE